MVQQNGGMSFYILYVLFQVHDGHRTVMNQLPDLSYEIPERKRRHSSSYESTEGDARCKYPCNTY